MFMELIVILIISFVVISLWMINVKLGRIANHFDNGDDHSLSDEEIEKELEEEWEKWDQQK
ncbi:hypothetical protein [Rossellomorea aquimaris]|uniref:ATP synthase F0 subunit 8 n=1 Tax=Rossellomorea aquimaris TaxID=189382 RepID=A0A1J6WX24_9BACI|nr:hypothetical protein [Rossellomorea aquimaris]OIU70433.1 hypothetical protein BHE18_12010 [Rossellomorea aquimaris]